MRCPKCGYISFDHIDTCLKCNKNIPVTSSQIEGTTYNVAPPTFLKFKPRDETVDEASEMEISLHDDEADTEIVDPDLDILVNDAEGEDEDREIAFNNDFGDLGDFEKEENFDVAPALSDDDGLDLGDFEDALDEQEPDFRDDEIQLDLPDELADISDLSPPKKEQGPASFSMDSDDGDDFSLDLDLELEDMGDDFSLDSGDADKSAKGSSDLDDLSLDDIGLSDDSPAKKSKANDDMDMDADLDFSLDLGDFGIDDK